MKGKLGKYYNIPPPTGREVQWRSDVRDHKRARHNEDTDKYQSSVENCIFITRF